MECAFATVRGPWLPERVLRTVELLHPAAVHDPRFSHGLRRVFLGKQLAACSVPASDGLLQGAAEVATRLQPAGSRSFEGADDAIRCRLPPASPRGHHLALVRDDDWQSRAGRVLCAACLPSLFGCGLRLPSLCGPDRTAGQGSAAPWVSSVCLAVRFLPAMPIQSPMSPSTSAATSSSGGRSLAALLQP